MASWLERCIAASLHRRRRSSCWSTTRDCAVITAACGRKHVGTRGRGDFSVPLYVQYQSVCVCAYVSALRSVCNVPWESIPLRKQERRGEKERGEIYTKAIPPDCGARAVFPINPVFRVFPPTLPWGRRFGILCGNRPPSIVYSNIDRPIPRGLNFVAGF